MIIKFHLVLVFLFMGKLTISQEAVFHNFSVDDGLVSSHVYNVMQDSKGYLWFGTNTGVSRYDGVQFENFTTENGLLDNEVLEIGEDSNGKIWFITLSGKLSYFENDKCYNNFNADFKDELHLNEIPLNEVPTSFFYSDNNGSIWLLTATKVICINESEDIQVTDVSEFGAVLFFWLDSNTNKKFIFCDPIGIIEFNNGEFKIVKKLLKDTITLKPFISNTGGVNFELNHQLVNFNGVDIKPTGLQRTKDEPRIVRTVSDQDHNLWTCSMDGFINYAEIGTKPNHLIDENISDILIDSEGGYWVTTMGNGVYYSPNLNATTFKGIGQKHSIPKVITTHTDKSVWVGYKNGDWLRIVDNKLDRLFSNEENEKKQPIYQIMSKHDIIWICNNYEIRGYQDNVLQYNFNLGSSKDISDNGNGILAVAKYDGLCIIDYNKLSRNKNPIPYSKILLNERSFAVHFDRNDNLWMSSQSGIHILRNNKMETFAKNKELRSHRITRIVSSNFDAVAFSSEGGGVFIWHKDSLYQIDKKNGLPSSISRGLVFNENKLWVATTAGLAQINFHNTDSLKWTINIINKSNGLLSNDVYDVALQDSTIWIGTGKGLCRFNKNEVYKKAVNFPFRIKMMTVNDKITPIQNETHLKYWQNTIGIRFEAIAYKEFGEMLFRYRMQGLDTAWNYTNERKIKFHKLTSGSYTFELEAQKSTGEWFSCKDSLKFYISTPFLKTIWFWLIMIIVVLLFAILIFRHRIKNVRLVEQNKSEIDRKISNLKHKALRSQMNPHFIFNALNAMQKLYIEQKVNKANDYMADFAQLLRLILDSSEETLIPISQDLEMLELYLILEKGRLDDEFNYVINVDQTLDLNNTEIPPLILQPIVENAIWHGIVPKGKGMVSISIALNKSDHLVCIVQDDGIGYETSKKRKANHEIKRFQSHKSKGMKIVEERLEGKENIRFEELKSGGTKVTLVIKNIIR